MYIPKANSRSMDELISNIAIEDGEWNTEIPGLKLYRNNTVTEPSPCMYLFGLGVIIQGNKRIMLGDNVHKMVSGQWMMTSADLPVMSCVTKASPEEPYLGLWLDLDIRIIAQQAIEMESPRYDKAEKQQGISVFDMNAGIYDALIRVLNLLHEPEALRSQLMPLIEKEIVIRLLSGPYGMTLRQLVSQESPVQKITRVLSWLKGNFTGEVVINDLAKMAHMSPSTFRLHFRSVTGMSPLQYLKQIRLLEARQLMLNNHLDAGSTALKVGYESASQFSREYTRSFGEPPQRDIRRLREAV